MSRKSHAFAFGQPAFSWRVERIPGGRFKATCKNNETISGTGETEQKALWAATKAMEKAVDSDDLGMRGPGQI